MEGCVDVELSQGREKGGKGGGGVRRNGEQLGGVEGRVGVNESEAKPISIYR